MKHANHCAKNDYTGATCTCGLDDWFQRGTQVIFPGTSVIGPGCVLVIPCGVTIYTQSFIPFSEKQALGWS
jgi:hypothetical protein